MSDPICNKYLPTPPSILDDAVQNEPCAVLCCAVLCVLSIARMSRQVYPAHFSVGGFPS
jgi:hypothetical protein